MDCPKCNEPCDRDSVDVGVGIIYGPYGCACGWSEDPRYDRSNGPSPAQLEHPDYYVDSMGGMQSVQSIVDGCARFGIPREMVEETFRVEPAGENNADAR